MSVQEMSGVGDSEAVAVPDSTQQGQQSNGQEQKNTQEQSTEQQVGTDIGPLEDKILRQIEYYFGDRNLPRDKFLQQAVANGEDGYVPIATLLTFNRLKALSSNEQLIAEVVRKHNSSIVQVNDQGTSIRRHPDKPLPDIFSRDLRMIIKGKTVYTKVFPEHVTLDQLQTFFGKFGKVEHIQMHRYGADEGRKFKGSVFVEFESKESADTYLQTEGVEFEGVALTKESKESYFQRKNEKRKAKKALLAEESEETTPPSMVVKEKNAVLHFSGCGANPTWESMKEALSEHATVAFVDFSNDDRTEGYVRFKDEGGATLAVQALNSSEGGASLLGAPTVVKVLEGDEELEYWTKLEANKKARAGKGRGGQKRKAGDDCRPSPSKEAKTED